MEFERKRGPKRLTYIPSQFRHISGIENLTTRRQLLKLKEYLAQSEQFRSPYVRLGASVPDYKVRPGVKPSATYAVSYDGKIEVIRFDGDPRRAEKWFRCVDRPWNLYHEFATEEVAS